MTVRPTIILFGGNSSEHAVSVASAQHVSETLPSAALWFEDKSGLIFPLPREELLAHTRPFEEPLRPQAKARWQSLAVALDEASDEVFFLAYHGGHGEDGTAQELFEKRGLAFTGSGSEASAAAFEKPRAKRLAANAGLSVAHGEIIPEADSLKALTERFLQLLAIRAHWVLKPAADGSSIGLYHLRRGEDPRLAAKAIFSAKRSYLAEEFLPGRELTIGVVECEEGLEALPASEVCLEPGATFDFAGKYFGRGNREVTPAPVEPQVMAAAQRVAVVAHQALGCYGYTRTDIIVTENGPYFLETNTLPGLTRPSFFPQQLRAANRKFSTFLQGQIDLAIRRK